MISYRFHVLGLPHTQTTKAFSNCAFTENVRKFCMMMKALGHFVYLYGSEDNEAPCDEFITCITKEEQRITCRVDGPTTVLNAKYEINAPHWKLFNRRCVEEIGKRVQRKDFVAVIAGDLSDPVIDSFPQAISIEHAVGYTGISQKTHRAFASSSWMHTVYGHFYGAQGTKGRFYDRVIPHCLDPDDFVYDRHRDDYFLFVGRCNEDKGVKIAADACKAIGARLIVAGQGPVIPEGVDYVGLIGIEERKKLMSRAKALFVPSLYLEPFGMVAIEGLLSGCPLITTDWGGLVEINQHARTGFRCHTMMDFVNAARMIDIIHPETCHQEGLRYSLRSVMYEYARWLDDLYKLWDGGWTALPENPDEDTPVLPKRDLA